MDAQITMARSVAAVLITLCGCSLAMASGTGACSRTSQLMRSACHAEALDDRLVEKAKCLNERERGETRECIADTMEAHREARADCNDQYEARLEVCDAIGEAPFDPRFEPGDFDTDLNRLTTPNPYFPMAIGHMWFYDGDEEIEIEVLNETKFIDDVTCFVVRDRVFVDGRIVEDTNDWFALGKADGAVWYCGEEVKDFEFFKGDQPSLPELVAIDGSFKVERDGARSGIFFPGNQMRVNDVYRQEFDLGNAEDIGEVVSVDYSFGDDPELDQLVPEALARALCSNHDCIVIAEATPLDPEVFERKYFARDIGFFLGTNPVDGEVVYLTGCSFNTACDHLPEL